MQQPLDDLSAPGGDRPRQRIGQHCRLGRKVDALQNFLHGGSHCGLLFRGQGCKRFAIVRFGDIRLGQLCDADEVVGSVILSEVGAHAINAAVIHQVGFLESGLASDHILGCHHDNAR